MKIDMVNLWMVGLLTAVLTGCATSGIEGTGKPMQADEIAKHVVIHNESLAADVMITEMLSRRQGDLLQVNVELTNQTSTDKEIQYLFTWYDADNFEVEQDARAWKPITLHGHSSVQMQAIAPNAMVTTYKVNVRELR